MRYFNYNVLPFELVCSAAGKPAAVSDKLLSQLGWLLVLNSRPPIRLTDLPFSYERIKLVSPFCICDVSIIFVTILAGNMDQQHNVKSVLSVTVVCLILYKITAQQCGSDISIFNMMLRRHTYKKLKTLSALQCIQACNDDLSCRSFNYLILKDICELNNRTKEARPEDFIADPHRYYSRRNKKLGR